MFLSTGLQKSLCVCHRSYIVFKNLKPFVFLDVYITEEPPQERDIAEEAPTQKDGQY